MWLGNCLPTVRKNVRLLSSGIGVMNWLMSLKIKTVPLFETSGRNHPTHNAAIPNTRLFINHSIETIYRCFPDFYNIFISYYFIFLIYLALSMHDWFVWNTKTMNVFITRGRYFPWTLIILCKAKENVVIVHY
jgi:hypothetical protein